MGGAVAADRREGALVTLARRAAQLRSRHTTAAFFALILMLLVPAASGAANVGGTSSGDTAPASVQPPASTSRHVTAVRITGVVCTPISHCSGNPHQVSTHGTLMLKGVGLQVGMEVGFPRAGSTTVTSRSPHAHLRKTIGGLLVTVPKTAHSGHIKVLLSHGRYTSSYGPIYVYTHALHPPAKPVVSPVVAGGVSSGALEGQGMWIWYVNRSNGGSVASIVAQAHAAGVSTLFIKSSDGSSNYWSQFSPTLVAELHANGLKVCAWQYVYGTNPAGEAALGAEAVASGADCLVIDAEAEYEGKYGAAQTYIADLRAKIGASYPLVLASFPYVYFHTSFPYSVFLGPEGAQYNAPQMYWKTIGQSVDTAYANTYSSNRIYARPIFPLGQTYEKVSAAELLRFREEAVDYGAAGWSFWDWQETNAKGWEGLTLAMTPLTSVTPNSEYPELKKGAKGDEVLWLQEHLASAEVSQETTGIFSNQTTANLEAFQSAHGIAASGVAEAATWVALLALNPVVVDWTGGKPAGG
jgi:peptidoglycan hydrolase-like protein with peptidoglycan-binding domain